MSKPAPLGDSAAPNPNSGVVDPASNAKLQQLQAAHANGVAFSKQLAAGGGCPFLQLQTGAAYYDDDHTLKAGARGPALLEDQVFREKMQHFDHERIPERIVHARGVGVHGYFQVYESQAAVTSAALFQDPSVKTPLFTRFSTVLGSRGAMDTARDVRGWATKFYTQEGNWDLVGNNIPVFFIQDAIKFPDLIHAGKPEPQTEMPQGATAHDNFWDFISWTPEAMHMITWAMSDRAIPRSLRMMQGFGVHTFALINAEGKRTFCKFHIRPILGVHGLVWDEAMKLGGVDPDFHRRDLYDAIASGNFPTYEFGFQLIPEEDEHKFEFDLLDCTKIVPEELVPIKWIGKIVYDRLPTDYFAETEQVAFCTANIVPGIDFTDDPMLQGRNFSYQDTQLSRLGGVNYNQIPINQPIVPVLNNQRDGHMQMKIHTDKLNYFPNRLSAIGKAPRPGNGGETQGPLLSAGEIRKHALQTYREKIEGVKERVKAPKFLECFNQASLFFNSQTPVERAHMLSAASFELSKVEDLGVRERMRDLWNEVDHEFAINLAKNIGVKPPTEPKHKNSGDKSAFLSMIASPYSKFDSIATRKVAVLIGDGFRSSELKAMQAALEKEGAQLLTVGAHRGQIAAEGGDAVEATFTLFNCKSVQFDALALIGGSHIEALQADGAVFGFVAETLKHHKAVSACSEGILLVESLCKVAGIKCAEQGGALVDDQGVVTSGAMSAAFSAAVINGMKTHRCWDRNVKKIPA